MHISTWIYIFHAGIGWGSVITTMIVSTYYNVVLAWALYFLGMSFTSHLPWADCSNSWNTPRCVARINFTENDTFLHDGNMSISYANDSEMELKPTPKSPSEEFFE